MAAVEIARRHRRVAGLPGGLLIVALLASLALIAALPRHPSQIEFPLVPPFVHQHGAAYIAKAPGRWASDAESPNASLLAVRESGHDLGPAHAPPDKIATVGIGSFIHWHNIIYFSTSDNSDPNTNGRTYVIVSPTLPLPLLFYASALLSLYLAWSWLSQVCIDSLQQRYGFGSTLRGALLVCGHVALATLFVHLVFGVLIASRLAREDRSVNDWYRFAFEGGAPPFRPGASSNYTEHHYLNYALNPGMPYGDARQYEPLFRIRRSEPIRERGSVRWRVLVLGGSTTFGERLPNEQDTWVHQLEDLVRGCYGPDVDVLNGGVGGYTIAENLIHYVTLLTQLSPDVVLLYTGINDVHPRLFDRLAHDYANYRLPWRSAGSILPPVNGSLKWFHPYRYYFLANEIIPLQTEGIGGLTARPYPPSDQWPASLDANGPEVYRDYLETLSRLILAQGRRVGILLQYFHETTDSDSVFARGVQQHNRVNQEIAVELKIPLASEIAEGNSFRAGDTFDSCHFTATGSERMAGLVFAFLKRSDLLPRLTRPAANPAAGPATTCLQGSGVLENSSK
jgi:lysophospholipase L1-like esterase